ncbi:MAG: ATP-binding protein [Methermicoccaceae archaeon]
MPVDMSGLLLSSFERTKRAYSTALKEGDVEAARSKAEECARLLRLLADHVPSQRRMYLEKAEKWERAASEVHTEHKVRESRQEDSDGFESYAEGLISTSKVKWDDIGGLDETKRLLMDTVVIAGIQKPESIKPWKGILLFGPPGTGKTLLASACAGSLDATLFSVQAGKVTSKYFGESSKLVSALYETAREHAPSIVFVDEFDSLSLSRGEEVSEASRRMLSTLLSELDGFQDKKSDTLVLTLAATNTPWSIDQAVLRRFPRRIYVPLPDVDACREIIGIHTRGMELRVDVDGIARECVDRLYSGSDIASLCQQAMWSMVRDENPRLHELAKLPYEQLRSRSLKTRALTEQDFKDAMRKIKPPITLKDIEKYERWNEEFGG